MSNRMTSAPVQAGNLIVAAIANSELGVCTVKRIREELGRNGFDLGDASLAARFLIHEGMVYVVGNNEALGLTVAGRAAYERAK